MKVRFYVFLADRYMCVRVCVYSAGLESAIYFRSSCTIFLMCQLDSVFEELSCDVSHAILLFLRQKLRNKSKKTLTLESNVAKSDWCSKV